MMNKPKVYRPEDLQNYAELLDKTDVLETPHKSSSAHRPRNTSKLKFLWRIRRE